MADFFNMTSKQAKAYNPCDYFMKELQLPAREDMAEETMIAHYTAKYQRKLAARVLELNEIEQYNELDTSEDEFA